MCGRYVSGDMTWQQYHDWLTGDAAPPPPEVEQSRHWNIPPTAMAPIAIIANGTRRMVMARWGLVPAWWQKPLSEMRFSTFNARSEQAAAKPFFRDAMKHAHCLVPALGYYEWQGPKEARQPWYIRADTNQPGLCFAGLWSRVKLADFQGYTFSILTRDATPPIAHLHQRQPVMLDAEAYQGWLAGEALETLPQIAPERLRFHKVAKAVGSIRNDGPELIEAVAA
ncbi:MAG: SOS response-associated peptidase [Rhodobacteraceae bacterium]|nr:SOS response-associated peptidase [Paracoccaceae bacterium]